MNKLLTILLVSAITLLCSCFGVDPFSQNDLKFVKPFNKTDTVIYTSEKGQVDTIIFSAVSNDTLKLRNLEQGFYDENRIKVSYALTKNSYHKLSTGEVHNEPHHFIQFAQAKHSHSSKEIYFLGLIFDQEYIESIDVNNKSEFTFSHENAIYEEVNINEGIKSFTLNFDKGILSFIDKNNIKWTADNKK